MEGFRGGRRDGDRGPLRVRSHHRLLRTDTDGIGGYGVLVLLILVAGLVLGFLAPPVVDMFVLILVTVILLVAVFATFFAGSPMMRLFALTLVFWVPFAGVQLAF